MFPAPWASPLGVSPGGKKPGVQPRYPLTLLQYIAIFGPMSAIRDAILRQMQKLGLTIYRVALMVKGKVPQRTVYAFLTGKTDAGTETASAIMEALGLAIVEKPKPRRGKRPGKEIQDGQKDRPV